MEKFRNKYRIKSTRLEDWDYRRNAAYFVTICTKNWVCFFGGIVEKNNAGVSENQMGMSKTGKLAKNFWLEIPKHFPFIKLDAFIVMPNHIHGIIIIDGDDDVETLHATSLQTQTRTEFMSRISPKKNSLSVVIRSYKSVVTKHARKINPDFSWQPRFYDHIIRNEKSLYKIRNYITNNPQKWNDDNMNPDKRNSHGNKFSVRNIKRTTVTS